MGKSVFNTIKESASFVAVTISIVGVIVTAAVTWGIATATTSFLTSRVEKLEARDDKIVDKLESIVKDNVTALQAVREGLAEQRGELRGVQQELRNLNRRQGNNSPDRPDSYPR